MVNLEFGTFSPYDDQIIDRTKIIAKATMGVQSVYVGKVVGDSNEGICVVEWTDEYFNFPTAVDNLVFRMLTEQTTGPVVQGTKIRVTRNDILEGNGNLNNIFGAPAQQFMVAKLKKDEYRAKWETLLQQMRHRLVAPAQPVGRPFASLQGVETPVDFTYFLIAGWQSFLMASTANDLEGSHDKEDKDAAVSIDIKYAEQKLYEAWNCY
ncbi:hypothetical protein FB107DRAFT_279465 [Schizophyllum commune]